MTWRGSGLSLHRRRLMASRREGAGEENFGESETILGTAKLSTEEVLTGKERKESEFILSLSKVLLTEEGGLRSEFINSSTGENFAVTRMAAGRMPELMSLAGGM